MKSGRPGIAVALIVVLVAGCGGSGGGTPPSGGGTSTSPPPSTTYSAASGVAQKGPLILGSTVTAQELDAALAPTGKQYSFQTTSDLGTFVPSSAFTSQYIGLDATGYYFDEAANAVSGGPITLNGYSDLAAVSVLNVNLLTTLEYQRVQNLVTRSGMSFTAAQTQAEGEVLAALNINNGSQYGPFSSLDLSKTAVGDKILTAISALFTYGNTSGNLSALIARFQSDIGANGVITNSATTATLAASAKALDASAVAANLNQKYASAGVQFAASDITDWIDQDGDGVVGKFKFQVADATETSTFAVPTSVTDPFAGSAISVSTGQVSVNGTSATGPVTIHAGDKVVMSPPAAAFPNGAVAMYLLSGSTRVARVTFVRGLTSIVIGPPTPSVGIGGTQQFVATGTFTDGSTADVTTSVAWASDAPSIATVGATTGLAKGVAVGTAHVSANSGLISGTTTLTVTPAALVSISLTPNPLLAGVGLARRLTATATYSDTSTGNVTSSVTWTSSAPSIATVAGGVVTGVANGAVTISATAGTVSASASVAVTSNVWAPAAAMILAVSQHTATLLPNGKVLIAGGIIQSGNTQVPSAAAELYDPDSDSWSSAASLVAARAQHTATLLGNGKVLVVGGWTGSGPTASAELYDPASNTWSSAGNTSSARQIHTATLLLSGKVLIVGDSTASASAEIYDPATNAWSQAASMNRPRMEPTSTLLPDGKVLVAGGDPTGTATMGSAEVYDPTADAWTLTGNMLDSLGGHASTLLPNGTVLVTGGYSDFPHGGTATESSEIYNPSTNMWSSGGVMSSKHQFHTASLLPSGKVIVAGGVDYPGISNCQTGTDIYDSSTGMWAKGPSLTTCRAWHTATPLPNKTLFVTGGFGQTGSPTSTTELYW